MSPNDKQEIGPISNNFPLIDDIRHMIEDTRSRVATAVNVGLTILYWNIGKRMREEILNGERAEYGQEIIASLGRELSTEYGNGFSVKNLRRMIQFAEVFPEEEIVVSLIRQLSWTHSLSGTSENAEPRAEASSYLAELSSSVVSLIKSFHACSRKRLRTY